MSGLIRRQGFADTRRGWVFTARYYSPRGWRIPLLLWRLLRFLPREGYGREASFQLSHLHSWLRKVRLRAAGEGDT